MCACFNAPPYVTNGAPTGKDSFAVHFLPSYRHQQHKNVAKVATMPLDCVRSSYGRLSRYHRYMSKQLAEGSLSMKAGSN